MASSKRVLVCDLDNTLYDWVAYFVPSFYSMIDVAVEIMECDREQLLDDMRDVHIQHQDAEHPFALLETGTVKRIYNGLPVREVAHILDPAFHTFNAVRQRNLKLHENVIETLDILSASNIILVAHTDSTLHSAMDRLCRLGLLKYFSRVYCRERGESMHPDPASANRRLEALPSGFVHELSHHQGKPNSDVLLEICAVEMVTPLEAAYVGDSVAHDVLMAKRAGVFAIWAAYGAYHNRNLYDALVRVSHWTPEKREQEERFKKEAALVNPDYVANRSFAEVLPALGR